MSNNSIFCPKCHKLTAQIIRNEDGVKVIQNGKVLLSLGKGSSGNSLAVSCPSGHRVKVEV